MSKKSQKITPSENSPKKPLPTTPNPKTKEPIEDDDFDGSLYEDDLNFDHFGDEDDEEF